MRFQLNTRLLLLVNVIGMAFAIGAIVVFYQVDMIVHGTLYDYGLLFNYEWAIPYWMFERAAIGLIVACAGFNAFSMAYIVLAKKTKEQKPRSVQPKLSVTKTVRIAEKEKPREERRTEMLKPTEVTDDGVEIAALPMVCNKCGKVFTQPLCMFDFKSGKPRLVNVCPYCNTVLAVSGNAKE